MAIRPSLQEFRGEARTWLAAHVAEASKLPGSWGEGPDSVAVFHDRTEAEEENAVAEACDWHRTKLSDGWAAITWPERYGGRGYPATYERAFVAEEARFDAPPVPEALMVTIHLVAPTIELLGTQAQKDRFVRRFLATDLLCCQLFSEPNAGSDLASVRCRLDRSGDGWVANGQKVWTSGARQCHYGFLIGRSDPAAPKHKGMTALLVPLDANGVETRPIRQMTGGSSFNEVFLNDVEVSDELRIGEVGEGWHAALTMLGFERSISGDGAGGVGGSWEQVLALARHIEATSDAATRQRLANLYIRTRLLDMANARTRGALAAGEEPGALGSIAKLFWTETMTETSNVVSGLLGPRLSADTGEWGTFAWAEHLLGAPGYRIAGGSDEIQRNIIGERMLGLPREPAPSS